MKTPLFVLFYLLFICCNTISQSAVEAMKVGTFDQEVRTFYTMKNGLPHQNINAVAVLENGQVYAATHAGLAALTGNKWQRITGTGSLPLWYLAGQGKTLAAFSGKAENNVVKAGTIYILQNQKVRQKINLPENLEVDIRYPVLALTDKILLGASGDLFAFPFNKTEQKYQEKPQSQNLPVSEIRQIAVSPTGEIVVATATGLLRKMENEWTAIYPREKARSWAPHDVRGVIFDRQGKLWFASPQGVGCLENTWSLYTGLEGLPYNAFTKVAAGEPGIVWFGTQIGAIRFDGTTWEYRQGQRWLPDDAVRDIVVTTQGTAWFATSNGIGKISRKPMTLAEKANWYEDEIDRYHRRTPYEYVLEVGLKAPGDKTGVYRHDSDNDGLWTSMYGAGECFAYAATKNPLAKKRAKKVFEAMRFLGQVTQGGAHPAPPGFIARTILPTSGHDPNRGRLARDKREKRERDKLWKIYEPRWPVSADGKWYWKTDTSSDELDGHYFFYGQYYDLVADTEAEKNRVRKHVQALTDHLIRHNFQLVDHDGHPTRWARFSPQELNFDQRWYVERGLNSLSMLSYLTTTAHITGNLKYQAIADSLVNHHSYLQNIMQMKTQRGIGTGNQSDDEMAFMCYYNLIKYEKDPERRSKYAISFWTSWRLEQPEMNPFFNFAYAAVCTGLSFNDPWGTYSTTPTGDWLEDAVETLKRFPLDRTNWRHTNIHRLDLTWLPEASRSYDEDRTNFSRRGYRNNGKVIPVDECYFNHWNRNPWELNTGGGGTGLGDGTVFLLPYYMGLYHGFILE